MSGILSCSIAHYTFVLAFHNSPVHVFNYLFSSGFMHHKLSLPCIHVYTARLAPSLVINQANLQRSRSFLPQWSGKYALDQCFRTSVIAPGQLTDEVAIRRERPYLCGDSVDVRGTNGLALGLVSGTLWTQSVRNDLQSVNELRLSRQ